LRGEEVAVEGDGGGGGRRAAIATGASSSDDDESELAFPPSSADEPPEAESNSAMAYSFPAGVAGSSEGEGSEGAEDRSSGRRSCSAEATRWTRRLDGARTIGCGCVCRVCGTLPPTTPAAVRASAAAVPPRTRLARVAV
jgi:hypothetical protein